MQAQEILNKIIEKAALVKATGWKLLKSDFAKIAAVVIALIILLTVVVPLFLNTESLKFRLSQKISQNLGSNFTIKGDVDISFLPSPKLVAQEVSIQNYRPKFSELDSPKLYNFSAKSIEIVFPIFNFSSGLSIKKIIFNDAILESHFINPNSETPPELLTAGLNQTPQTAPEAKAIKSGLSDSLFSLDEIKIFEIKSSQIPDISINNGQRISYDFFNRKREIKSINAEVQMDRKKLEAEGNFNSDGIASNFKAQIKFNSTKKHPDSSIEITSPVLNLKIEGNFLSENKLMEKHLLEHDFSGKIIMEISELKSFYKSYIDAADVLAEKLKYNGKPIKVTAEIENKNNEGVVKNLAIDSGLINGKGEIHLSCNKTIPLIDIDLSLENVDLDSILSGEVVAVAPVNVENIAKETEVYSEENAAQYLESSAPVETKPEKTINLDITKKIKDFDLTAEVTIANTKYFNGQIKDANLYLTVSKQGEILIMPLIFKIPGDGILRVNGAIDNSAITPKFIGKIDAEGKNLGEIFKWLNLQSQNLKLDNLKEYNLYSDIFLLPNSATLNNFYLGLVKDGSEFLGEIKIDNAGKILNTSSRFFISHFDVDDYFFTSGQNAYLSPGLLLKKLLWLNNLSSSNSFDLKFERLIYGNQIFIDQAVKLRFGHGFFDISNLNLKSEKTSLKLDLAVDISSHSPRFDLSVDGEKYEHVTPQNNKNSEDKIEVRRNFFDQFYALPSLEEFGGKISLRFNDLVVDGINLNNLKLSGILKDGNISNAEFNCDLYSGTINYKGLLGLKLNKTINGNFTYTNASLKPLLSDVLGINNISGVANFSASITSVADSKKDFAKALTSEIKFSATSPSVEGYGLTDLIKKMFSASSYRQDLQTPEMILQNPQAITSFKQAKGTYQISGGQGGKLKIDLSAPAVNAILSGSYDPLNNTLDGLFNAIFLTGNIQKQTAINIATGLKGKTDNLQQSTNLDQARQYLGLPKITRIEATLPSPSAPTPTADVPSQNQSAPAPAGGAQ